MGPLILMFWSFGDVGPGFHSQGGFPHLHVLSSAHNRMLRFTSGMIPADLLVAAEPFLFMDL